MKIHKVSTSHATALGWTHFVLSHKLRSPLGTLLLALRSSTHIALRSSRHKEILAIASDDNKLEMRFTLKRQVRSLRLARVVRAKTVSL